MCRTRGHQRGLWLAAALAVVLASGCAGPHGAARERGAVSGGLIGAAAGAIVTDSWRGAAVGGLLGAVVGSAIAEDAARSSERAARSGRRVVYSSPDGTKRVVSEPIEHDAEAHCHRIHERAWEDGALVSDRVVEVCESSWDSRTNTHS